MLINKPLFVIPPSKFTTPIRTTNYINTKISNRNPLLNITTRHTFINTTLTQIKA